VTTDLDRLLAGDIDGDQLSPIKRLFTLGDAVRVLRRIAGKLGVDILDPTPKTVDSLMRLDLPAGVDIEIKL